MSKVKVNPSQIPVPQFKWFDLNLTLNILFSLTDEEKLNKISSLEKKIKTFVVENIQLKKKNEQMKNAILKQREIMLGNGFFKKILFIFKNSGGHPILSFGVPYFSDIWDL